MAIIICNVLVALFALAVSIPMANIIDDLADEKKLTAKGILRKRNMNVKIALITALVLIALFYKYGFSYQFVAFAFLAIILIMDAFVDMKAEIIPNILNFVGFLIEIVLTYIMLVMDFSIGIDMLLGMFVGARNI